MGDREEGGGDLYFSRSHADFEGRCCGVGNMGKQGTGEEVWISAGLCQEDQSVKTHKRQNFSPPSFHEMSFGQAVVEEEEGYFCSH